MTATIPQGAGTSSGYDIDGDATPYYNVDPDSGQYYFTPFATPHTQNEQDVEDARGGGILGGLTGALDPSQKVACRKADSNTSSKRCFNEDYNISDMTSTSGSGFVGYDYESLASKCPAGTSPIGFITREKHNYSTPTGDHNDDPDTIQSITESKLLRCGR